jgi:hypothetical protein
VVEDAGVAGFVVEVTRDQDRGVESVLDRLRVVLGLGLEVLVWRGGQRGDFLGRRFQVHVLAEAPPPAGPRRPTGSCLGLTEVQVKRLEP